MKIDKEDPKARFLCTSAVTGKSGDNLRSFLALVEMFQPEGKPVQSIIQVLMSDRAYVEMVGRMRDHDHQPADWMQDQDLPDNNWSDLKPHDNLEGEIVQVIKWHPEDRDGE